MPVYGEGPKPCQVMLVGEAFGYHEQLHQRPFYIDESGNTWRSGKSALELTRMLERSHLPRANCYLTNLCNFQPPQRNGKQLAPTKEDIEHEMPRLVDELRMVRPRWIGAIGRHSARVLTGQAIDMEWSHGLCYRTRICLKCGKPENIDENRNFKIDDATGRKEHRRLLDVDWVFKRQRLREGSDSEEAAQSASRDVRDANRSNSGRCTAGSPVLDSFVRESAAPRASDHSRKRPESFQEDDALPSWSPTHGGEYVSAENYESERRSVRDRMSRMQEAPETLALGSTQRPPEFETSSTCCGAEALETWISPLYHPAAGLHNPSIARFVWFDIQQFAKYVHGTLTPSNPIDAYPRPSYVSSYWFSRDAPVLGIDTEGYVNAPWSIQISSEPGKACVITADKAKWLSQLDTELHAGRGKLVGHNWLHDWRVCRALGIDMSTVDFERVEDTMLMSFCLGTLPLGLKPLSRRVSGAIQQSYSEVIAPAERKLALSYITRAIDAKVCKSCNGTGKIPAYGKTGAKKGQLLKRQDKCPNADCVDGGLWPAREGRLAYNWDDGSWKLTYGWQVQRYLRSLKADIEAGTFNTSDSDDEDDEDDNDAEGERKPRTIRQRWASWDSDVRGPVEELLGEMPAPTLSDIPRAAAITYAARDADLTLRNFPVLDKMIDEAGLRAAYRLDLAITPACAEMEQNGMAVDVAALGKLSRRLRRENDVILRKIQHIAKRPINPASGDQVAGLLFGERRLNYSDDDERELQPELALSFGLESQKRTKSKSRASTDDKVLEGLKLKYADRPEVVEVVQLILDYRVRHKIDTTYAEKIPRIAIQQPDGHWRVHTHIRQTVAATYRLASSDPINLQNIPVRSKGGVDLGRLVRECFGAPEGYVLASSDYSQVELRVLAALSGDDGLLRAFREGLDPHLLGASRAWRMDYDEMFAAYKAGDRKIADIRESAKNLNFGIVFGITARGLQAQMELRGLRYTLDECNDLIQMWIRRAFPGIGAYIEEVQSYGKLHGYAKSFMGHMRHCPGVWSDIPQIREEALRQLVNFSIQCSAAEILKVGLADLWNRGKRTLDRVGSRLLMSVHDENLLEVREDARACEITSAVVEGYMENPIKLPNGVDIATKVKFAKNWGALKAA